MKKAFAKGLVFGMFFLFVSGAAQIFAAEKTVVQDERCPVCGMFVAKYPEWITRLEMSDGHIHSFDGVKDMMAYFNEPQKYGAAEGVKAVKVLVKDYYTLDWVDGKTALYVIGGDVMGPMGHELVPFASREAAENFMNDHHGEKILSFADITPELIGKMRHGHKMKGMN